MNRLKLNLESIIKKFTEWSILLQWTRNREEAAEQGHIGARNLLRKISNRIKRITSV